MSQNEQTASSSSSNYHSAPPTKQELKAPLLDKGTGGHTLPLYVPPGRNGGGDSRVCAFIGTVVKLSVFHFFNAVLSIAGGVLIHVGVDICVALIPLCCLGILLFPVVFFFVGVFAKLDVKLYNFISPPSEHVYLDLPQDERPLFGGESQDAFLSPRVFSFSPQSIAVAVYFCTIKLVVGVLSGVAVTVNVWLLLAPVAQLTSKDSYAFQVGGQSVDARRNPLVFTLVWVCVLMVNVALMHLFAKLSRASTRFFCCEKLSTYRYVNAA